MNGVGTGKETMIINKNVEQNIKFTTIYIKQFIIRPDLS